MDLLTNAIESIQLGVEDFTSDKHSRLLAAVRNIHAGILLLYKEALRRLSPESSNEVLIKAKIIPKRNSEGKLIFIGDGNTVNNNQIQERFKGLSIYTEWDRFYRINKIRNEIEHHYTEVTQNALRGVISDAFIIVRNFITNQLGGNPHELLGDETWQTMLDVSEVYNAEREECEQLLQSINWESKALKEGILEISCQSCGSQLLRPEAKNVRYDEVKLQCRSCGEVYDPESFIPRAIKEALYADAYLSYTDGGDDPYVDCPECGEDTYVVDEGRCAFCGYEAEHTCELCGNTIPPSELSASPLCGYCEHMLEEDD